MPLSFYAGPYGFFWTQAAFTAVAGVMVLAPLAFLALETEHFLARRIFIACGANGDGKLTQEEMVGAFEKWFRDWDQGSKGSLDASALGNGLHRILGPPPMFGGEN